MICLMELKRDGHESLAWRSLNGVVINSLLKQ